MNLTSVDSDKVRDLKFILSVLDKVDGGFLGDFEETYKYDIEPWVLERLRKTLKGVIEFEESLDKHTEVAEKLKNTLLKSLDKKTSPSPKDAHKVGHICGQYDNLVQTKNIFSKLTD
jgi:hypothetical protein